MDNPGAEDEAMSPKSVPSSAVAPDLEATDDGHAALPSQANAPPRPPTAPKFQSEPILDKQSRIPANAVDSLYTGTASGDVATSHSVSASPAPGEESTQAPTLLRGTSLPASSNTSRHLPMGPPQTNSQVPGNTASSQSKMTVETETVPSVPALGVATAGNSSLKQKRSQDSVPRLHNTHRGGLGGSTNGGTAGRKRSLRLGQGSKADIFAAKVASAVDEANSSDSDETFVYDMHTREPRTLERSRLGGPAGPGGDLTRDSSRESRHIILHPEEDEYNSSSDYRSVGVAPSTELAPHQLRRPYLRTPSNASIVPPQNGGAHSPRPADPTGTPGQVPRAFVTYSPRRKESSQRTKNTYLQRWRTLPGASGVTDDDDEGSGYMSGHAVRGTSLGERQPLFNGASRQLRYSDSFDGGSPHDFSPKSYKTPLVVRVTLWMVSILIGILALMFLAGLGIIASRPLSELDAIALNSVFTSDKELVFSMILRAKNPGLFSITIEQAEMDVFATSAFINLPGDDDDDGGDDEEEKSKPKPDVPKTPRTMLLGTIHTLQSPVTFPGGFINPQVDFETVSVKLLDPARNGSDTSAWEHIIEHPFDLTVKGTLKYSLLLGGEYRVSVSAATPVTPPLYSGDLL